MDQPDPIQALIKPVLRGDVDALDGQEPRRLRWLFLAQPG